MNPSVFFNAHHSPAGAFSTFTLGKEGMSGGLGMELSGPANQNIYIGLESSDKKNFDFLPFFELTESVRSRFKIENQDNSNKSNHNLSLFGPSEIKRDFNLATDTWSTDDLTFTIHSPVLPIPDPLKNNNNELKKALIPAIFIEITIDNSRINHCRKAIFGFQGNDTQSSMRRIDDTMGNKITGIGQGRHCAICTSDSDVVSGLAFTIEELIYPKNEEDLTFGLGTTGALIMTASPNEIRAWRFTVCFYKGGIVTAGMDTSYYYTNFFKNIEDVAEYSFKNFEYYKAKSYESNLILDKSGLSYQRKFMIAHAVRSYYGNTQLMHRKGEPVWIVNEGEYRMMNTFDLTVDHLFFELKMNPWTVKNTLDLYTERYSYTDSVHSSDNKKLYPGGIGFTHDMGVANTFSRPHYSVYELKNHTECFSYMTQEQLSNWLLCGSLYYSQTLDFEWLQNNKTTFEECFESMLNRDHFEPSKRDGVMDFDSSRTGTGSEITTYDNVDRALGQARRNSYLALKCWAVYVSLQKIFLDLHSPELAQKARISAALCAQTIIGSVKDNGTIPAILDKENGSVTISVIEGLAYVWLSNKDLIDIKGPYGKLISVLKKHCETVLSSGLCVFDDGGWRLSSTSNNSWLSKIFLCQFITHKILNIPIDHTADQAHLNWLINPQNSYFAWSDQMANGIVVGSRYYPRGVTSILWLYE